MNTGDRSPVRLRLHADRALWHEEGACLPLRSRHGQCHACADSCPSAALAVSVDAVVLTEACTGCGRCTAACPTQALTLPEVTALPLPSARTSPLTVECRKVPAELRAPDALVLPCLGALTSGRLLAHAAAGVHVRVLDRGWCQGCEAGCSEARPAHPATPALEAAGAWLEAMGAPVTCRLEASALAPGLRPNQIPPAIDVAPAMDRRRFFRAALEKPAGREKEAAAAMGGDGKAAYPADARRPSPERELQLASLQTVGKELGHGVPAEFFPSLQADASCCDSRMCVALCPTAALTVGDDGATARLQFDPVRCIACGTCVRACPEGSLVLSAHGGEAGLQTLATHSRRRCPSCGDAFSAATTAVPDEAATPPLCPTCTKSHRFMDDARRQLFGALN